MKKCAEFSVICLTLAFLISTFSNAASGQQVHGISVVPKPVSMKLADGVFMIDQNTVIIVDAKTQPVGDYLSKLFSPALGYSLKVATKQKIKNTKPAGGMIVLEVNAKKKSNGAEGYELKVTPDKVTINAAAPAGTFYGVQTLRQLLPPEIDSKTAVTDKPWTIPCLTITDKPRFVWRGLMLDTARHFFPKDFVLKYIDMMSAFKFNRLHLHLTDDQGWRIEIKQYPELTKIGAWRGKSKGADYVIGGATGKAHGGFYTQDDIHEIVAYAAKHYITVVPEIEMPGHCQGALAAYNDLSCRGAKLKVLTHWGVNPEVYCAGNDKTFKFLEGVLTETVKLFPGEYIHIGGDEVPKDRWKECPKCQERIKKQGLKDEAELQSYFVKRMEKYLNSKGKKIIGWDEILEGGLPPRAMVMSWRGTDGGIKAAQQGHDVIMSPTSNCYFDYPQAPEGEPEQINAPAIPMCKVYAFEPVPDALDTKQAKHILGTQANLWTEHVETTEHAEYLVYPRAAALAEVAWTQKDLKNWSDFQSRMMQIYPRLGMMGINYRAPKDGDEKLCQ